MNANLRLLEREEMGLNGRRSFSFVLAASCSGLMRNTHFGEASQDVQLDSWGKNKTQETHSCHQPDDCIEIERYNVFVGFFFVIFFHRLPFGLSVKLLRVVWKYQRFKTVLR